MDAELAAELLAAALRMGTPLLLLGLAEMLAERSGTVNLGLEGSLLVGCFASVALAVGTGSAWIGVLGAVLAAVALATLFALLTIGFQLDQVLVGTAVNLLGFGLTGFLYRTLFGVTGSVLSPPGFSAAGRPLFDWIPFFGPALSGLSWIGWLALLTVPLLALLFRRTQLGLALDAAGQLPEGAAAAGWNVTALRIGALVVSGALAGLAGAYLALVQAHGFVEGMSGGRGFIALAIVIFGRWRPWGILAASLFFGLALAGQFHLQAAGSQLPYQLVRALPYLVTLTVLAIVGPGRASAPASLGRPLQRDG